jgi:hypothetical protein
MKQDPLRVFPKAHFRTASAVHEPSKKRNFACVNLLVELGN